jgi:glutamine synthetase
VNVAPRSILRRQIGLSKYQCFAATELEHYLFRTSYRDASHKGYRDLEAAGWYLEDYHILQGTRTENFHAAARRHLKLSGVPVETSKGEWGNGQHEVNVRYAEALDMADRHVLFKQCLKELAESMGMSVTFMAKPDAGGAGSSCHITSASGATARTCSRRTATCSAGSSAAGWRACPS